MKKLIVASILILFTTVAHARDRNVEYVGQGRYHCNGSDCGRFNAEQRGRNESREYQERRTRERSEERSERRDRRSYR